MTRRQQVLYWLAALVLLLAALYLLRTILLPFVAGVAVAYFLDPVADMLERRRLPRGLAAALVLFVFFLLVLLAALLVLPVLQQQIVGFAANLPKYVTQLRTGALPPVLELLDKLGVDYSGERLREAMSGVTADLVGFLGDMLKRLWAGGLAVVNILSLLFITPIVAFYLLRDWDLIVARIDGLLPRQHHATIAKLAADVDEVMAGFLRGQGTVCLILGAFYATALSLAGLDFGLIIGMLAGLVSFIPFVGAVVGLLLSLTQALMQFWPDYIQIGLVVAIFVAGQVAEGNFLTPRLLGDRVGLHPVWVMFGLLAGGALFGFVGVLLAVPLTAAIGVVARFMVQRYQESQLYLHQTAVAAAEEPPPAATAEAGTADRLPPAT